MSDQNDQSYDPPTPFIAAAVHYVSHGTPVRPDGSQAYPSVCRAAFVTEAGPSRGSVVGLCVLNPQGMFFDDDIKHSTTGRPGTWHWPGPSCGGVGDAAGQRRRPPAAAHDQPGGGLDAETSPA